MEPRATAFSPTGSEHSISIPALGPHDPAALLVQGICGRKEPMHSFWQPCGRVAAQASEVLEQGCP